MESDKIGLLITPYVPIDKIIGEYDGRLQGGAFMANRLILRDRRKDRWGRVNVRLFWEGGGQDGVWVDESGNGEFGAQDLYLILLQGAKQLKYTKE